MTESDAQFIATYDAHADEIFRHCYRALGDRETALDLTQETFFRAWRHIREEREAISNMRAFLYTIATNLIRNAITRRRHATALSEWEEVTGRELEDETRDVIRDAEGFEVVRVLQRLPEPDRALITARYFSGLSLAELGERFGISTNAVGVRLHRALGRVRFLLNS